MDIWWIASVSKRYSSFGYHAGYQNNPDNLPEVGYVLDQKHIKHIPKGHQTFGYQPLHLVWSSSLDTVCAAAVNPKNIEKWFVVLRELLVKHGFHPDQIYGFDEWFPYW
jgi:hypothetical protein